MIRKITHSNLTSKRDTKELVLQVLNVGYRHIDTVQKYEVNAVNDFASKFNVDTYQIFVVSENQLELYFWCNKNDWHKENEYNIMITVNL